MGELISLMYGFGVARAWVRYRIQVGGLRHSSRALRGTGKKIGLAKGEGEAGLTSGSRATRMVV